MRVHFHPTPEDQQNFVNRPDRTSSTVHHLLNGNLKVVMDTSQLAKTLVDNYNQGIHMGVATVSFPHDAAPNAPYVFEVRPLELNVFTNYIGVLASVRSDIKILPDEVVTSASIIVQSEEVRASRRMSPDAIRAVGAEMSEQRAMYARRPQFEQDGSRRSANPNDSASIQRGTDANGRQVLRVSGFRTQISGRNSSQSTERS